MGATHLENFTGNIIPKVDNLSNSASSTFCLGIYGTVRGLRNFGLTLSLNSAQHLSSFPIPHQKLQHVCLVLPAVVGHAQGD